MIETGIDIAFRQQTGIALDLALNCAPGELVALVGPSGSGKSTVLRSIAGLHHPQAGRVSCNGAVWFDTAAGIDLAPHRRRVGLVFQNYALFPHLSALDNVGIALSHRPAAERESRARALLELVHLHALADRFPTQLSGGQQQRVAVARALAREPDVLLLDEPFSAVDKVTRRKLYRELAELRARLEMPTLLVTHDFDEAARLADRICLLAGGRGLQTGTPAEVLAHPVSVEAARLVDLQNLFEATVLAQSREMTTLDWHGRRLEAPSHPEFAPGTRVAWAVPSTQVILLRAGQPPLGARGTQLVGTIDEIVALSESTGIVLRVAGADAPRLALTVPARFALSAGLAVGRPAEVLLLADGIHVMPADPGEPGSD